MKRLLRTMPFAIACALIALFVATQLPMPPRALGVLAQAQTTPTPPRYVLDVPPYLDGLVTCVPSGATVELHILPLNPSQVIVRCVVLDGTPVPTPINTPTDTPLTPTPTVTPPGAPSPAPTTLPVVTLTLVPLPSSTPSIPIGTQTPSAQAATIVLTASQTFQTIQGWQSAGIGPVSDANYPLYQNALYTATEDLGINNVRLEVARLAGQPSFDLAGMDNQLDKGIVPYRTLLASHGKTLVIDLCVVGGGFSFATYGAGNAQAFANAMAALYQHMQSRYGFIPDSVEILEPNTFGWFAGLPSYTSAGSLADIWARTGDALITAGYTPTILFPSTSTSAPFATTILSQIWNDPDATQRTKNRAYIKAFSFHDYNDPTDANMVASGNANGLPTMMLEHIGATYTELHRLLKFANLSLFEQYTLAFATVDNGAQYFTLNGTTLTMGSRTKLLRQYMHFIQPGAVRIGASGNSAFDPVAFINPDGKVVVVVSSSGGTFSVSNLPAGLYGITYSTASQYNVTQPDVNLGAGQTLSASIPITGALTIYGK